MSHAVDLHDEVKLVLPPSLIGRVDISRLLREIEKVDNELEAQEVRNPNQAPIVPSMSRTLVESTGQNQVNISDLHSRREFIKALRSIKEHAPIVHLTFAMDAEPEHVSKLVAWIRQNLHPTALITVGVQPSIVGGCIVRTPDHIYDFSLRKQFKQQLPALIEEIRVVTRTA